MSKSNRWFQPQDGIAREVISADIQRYLGRDALVRPGLHEGQEGYWITAYRNLTTEMVRDLQNDSQRWRAEQQGQPSRRGRAPQEYTASQTHQSRQYYGPTETPAPTMESQYAPPPAQENYGGGRDPYGQQAVRVSAGYTAQPGYTQTAGYQQAAGYGHAQPGYVDTAYQSPQSQYSSQSYSSSTAASFATGASGYPGASPQHQYSLPQSGAQYVTSTTPQSFDGQQVPRTTTSAYPEGYQQPPDQRAATAADPYAGFRTGQPTAPQGYGYQQGLPGNASREQVYSSGHATAPAQTSSATQYYTDQYGRAPAVADTSSSKRRHEGTHHTSSHRRR